MSRDAFAKRRSSLQHPPEVTVPRRPCGSISGGRTSGSKQQQQQRQHTANAVVAVQSGCYAPLSKTSFSPRTGRLTLDVEDNDAEQQQPGCCTRSKSSPAPPAPVCHVFLSEYFSAAATRTSHATICLLTRFVTAAKPCVTVHSKLLQTQETVQRSTTAV